MNPAPTSHYRCSSQTIDGERIFNGPIACIGPKIHPALFAEFSAVDGRIFPLSVVDPPPFDPNGQEEETNPLVVE